MTVKIGFQLIPMFGYYDHLKARWMEAEVLGVDALYSADHFFPHGVSSKNTKGDSWPVAVDGMNFEGTVIEAAMAATTTRAQIGCMMHATGFRNPNLMADIARTIDHISGGRYILGMGSGYMQKDYEDYGYEWGTVKSRLSDLARDVAIIKSRFEKLNPPPIRKIPLMMGSMGEKVGMRIAAEHADIWHVYGPIELIARKIDVMKGICREIGREFSSIELCTWYFPHILGQETDPSEYLALGIRNIIQVQYGPKWDLGLLRELLTWRSRLSISAPN